jgi:hypothetical protein
MTSAAQEFLAAEPGSQLHNELKNLIHQHADAHPRSAQAALGPSEVGHPCLRKLVQGLIFGSGQTMSGDIINPPGDPLPAYIGVAGHSKIEEAVHLDNLMRQSRGQQPRWISERKVTVRHDLSGTCDLYDLDTDTVIDVKFPGTTAMTRYKKEGPSPEYRVQAHLYGAGYRNEGYNVTTVGIWFLPRAGQLASSYLWTEPYNHAVVDDVLTRIDLAHSMVEHLALGAEPQRLNLLPKTPHNCGFCPYFTPVPHTDPTACPGEEALW